MVKILDLRDRELSYGIGATEFPWNGAPCAKKAIEMHSSHPVSSFVQEFTIVWDDCTECKKTTQIVVLFSADDLPGHPPAAICKTCMERALELLNEVDDD